MEQVRILYVRTNLMTTVTLFALVACKRFSLFSQLMCLSAGLIVKHTSKLRSGLFNHVFCVFCVIYLYNTHTHEFIVLLLLLLFF